MRNMKLLVFSDSHGNTANMLRVVEMERPDGIFHLGDLIKDTLALREQYPGIPLYSVCGNCDGWSDRPEEVVVTLERKKILMMHGHTRGVKSGPGVAVFAAHEAEAHVLLYGHTHQPHCELLNGLWILNPGSVGSATRGTYGVIALEHGKLTCYMSTVS